MFIIVVPKEHITVVHIYMCACSKYVTKSGEFQKNIPGGLTRVSSFNTQKGKIGDTLLELHMSHVSLKFIFLIKSMDIFMGQD